MWDLVSDQHSIRLLEHMSAHQKPIAAVCHAPVVFRDVLTAEDWHPHVVTDGRLVTGQNPASSQGTAEALLQLLQKRH